MMVRLMNWLFPSRSLPSTAHLDAVMSEAADGYKAIERAAHDLRATAETSISKVEVEREVISGRADRRQDRRDQNPNTDIRRMAADALARMSRSQ